MGGCENRTRSVTVFISKRQSTPELQALQVFVHPLIWYDSLTPLEQAEMELALSTGDYSLARPLILLITQLIHDHCDNRLNVAALECVEVFALERSQAAA